MGSQKGNTGTGNKSAKHSSLKSKKTTNVNTKKSSQTHNTSGTKYSGKLADFMSERNKPKAKASTLDKTMTRRPGAFSPEDVAAAAGRLAKSKEMENQYGSRNKARASFAGLIDAQQDRLNNYSAGPRFRDELGQVREAPNTFARSVFNEATGVNPTTGMGILDSIKHNYAMSQGIPGSGLLGAGLSLASAVPGLGILANPILDKFFPTQDEEGVNKFGMPEYDLRTINEYSTNPTYNPSIEDESPSLSFNDDAFAAALDNPLAMRQMLPRNLNLSNQLRLSNLNPRLSLTNTNPRLSLPKPGPSLTGINLRPTGTTLTTAGSPYQNSNMLNQKLSQYGTVGNTSAKAQPKFSMPANKFGNPLSFLGKRSIPGMLMSGLSAVSSLDQGQPEDGSTFSEALDNLNRPMFNYNDEAVNPVFDFDPFGFLSRSPQSLNMGGSVAPQRGPMSNGIGTLYKLK